jgi:hypothetical protein
MMSPLVGRNLHAPCIPHDRRAELTETMPNGVHHHQEVEGVLCDQYLHHDYLKVQKNLQHQ